MEKLRELLYYDGDQTPQELKETLFNYATTSEIIDDDRAKLRVIYDIIREVENLLKK